MLAVATGIAEAYAGTLLLAGGTQQLAVAAVLHALGQAGPADRDHVLRPRRPERELRRARGPCRARTRSTSTRASASSATPASPGYCAGEVKEGTGAGGALALAALLGHSPDAIREAVLAMAMGYS